MSNGAPPSRALLRFQPTDASHRVTTFELFFDLVFVFAFTQVTALMADDPTARGAVRGLLLMALLWWAWCSYAWLGNQAHAEEGVVRLTMLAAMAAVFMVALAIPEAFDDRPGGLDAPVVLAVCYVFVRVIHLACYLVAATGDAALQRQLLVTAVPVAGAGAVLVTGALVGPPYQTGIWALALLIDYVGIWVAGTSGWRLTSASHFAERHGLILIVAIGESMVALGVGVAAAPLSVPVLTGAVLGIAVSGALWWLYFDVVARVAEEVLAASEGEARSRLARDSYTYLHFPLVVSVIFIALGLKKTLEYVVDHDHLGAALTGVPLLAMYLGVAVYLLAHVAFRWRNVHSWNPHRTIAALVLMALVPVAWRLPAIASLGLVAGVLVALVTYEVVRFGEARDLVRHRSAHG
ncbi:MAG: low temperature requirement protein A [Nocardioides sp.]